MINPPSTQSAPATFVFIFFNLIILEYLKTKPSMFEMITNWCQFKIYKSKNEHFFVAIYIFFLIWCKHYWVFLFS